MLINITHANGLHELVEAPEPPEPYHYIAPWEEDQIQTRPDGSQFITHEGGLLEVEAYVSEFGESLFRAREADK